jgi:subfamily B ATP-binding cassette protein MsbA
MNLSSRQLYLRLLGYVKPYWRTFAISILGTAVTAATEPLLPALLKPLLDGTFVHKDNTIIQLAPLFILVIFFVRGMASFVASYAIGWVGNKVVMDLRDEMFHKLLTLPTRYYDDHATGNLISKLTFDVTQVTAAATNVVTVSIRDSIIIIGLLGWLFYLNWKLTLLSLVMAPIIAIMLKIINTRLRDASRDSQRAMGDITQVIEESVAAHKVVKLFGGQQYESIRFNDQANWVRRHTMKQTMAAAINVPIVQMIAAIALSIIVYLATVQSHNDETTVGGFLSFIAAMLMLTAPIKRLTSVSEFLQRGLAASESVFELLDTPGETNAGKITIGRANGRLEFENVNLSYQQDDRLALRNINLKIPAGQAVALVGASGSGKTTMANLVPRFYLPSGGRITLDGHDLADLTLASLRANIALVSQEVVLFNDTVAANIAYGQMREVPETEIIAAAQAAHAMEFIREMPQGLNTLVGERGVKLSGGQRQRIAIARALALNPKFIMLDEPTSALDMSVQAQIVDLLRGLQAKHKLTYLFISHDLKVVRALANDVVVMRNGVAVESGPTAQIFDAPQTEYTKALIAASLNLRAAPENIVRQ